MTGIGAAVLLQPCPHCGAKVEDAYKQLTVHGMGYFVRFEYPGCRLCYGKSGVLRVFPLSEAEITAAEKFRYKTQE